MWYYKIKRSENDTVRNILTITKFCFWKQFVTTVTKECNKRIWKESRDDRTLFIVVCRISNQNRLNSFCLLPKKVIFLFWWVFNLMLFYLLFLTFFGTHEKSAFFFGGKITKVYLLFLYPDKWHSISLTLFQWYVLGITIVLGAAQYFW